MDEASYIEFLRNRITELRLKKDVSEHRMSLDLDKSGSYIRGITSGASLPSVGELFNIILYFNISATEFFAPAENTDTPYHIICNRLREFNSTDLQKVCTFIDWIAEDNAKGNE